MPAALKTPILFLGATGYIGGSVLARLLARPDADSLEITALVRSEAKARKLEAFGIKTVLGSIQDTDVLENLASQSHVVFSIADCDDVPQIEAILRGLKTRRASGDYPILIHTSGTGVFVTEAKGMYPRELVYDDTDPAQIETLPLEAQHRPVDLRIVQADKEGYVRTYIILPCAIYGIASTVLTAAGVQNPYSVQIPTLIRAALARKQGGMVGRGAAVWNNVHVDDVADLYLVLYSAVTAPGSTTPHGREGFYIAENGTHAWSAVGKQIAQVLYDRGLGGSPEPTTFSARELVEHFGSEETGNFLVGSNSRGVANRSRAVGWKPRYTNEDMLASIAPEVEAVLKQQGSR